MHFGVGEVHFGRTATHFVNMFIFSVNVRLTSIIREKSLCSISAPYIKKNYKNMKMFTKWVAVRRASKMDFSYTKMHSFSRLSSW